MTTTNRQNSLLLNQDWKTIYQTFKNADFKSYDFENLRRVMINYLRENYPEDFNDYIESSEYMALIDAIAFVGQSLAFRIDLNSRENFIELAETKDSVVRLARLLSYNPKRNIAASGLLKFDTISTTEDILDGNGRNLSQQVIIWNDPTNPNWFEQFILVLNSAMSDNTEFGRSQGTADVQGIPSQQYRFRSIFTDIPLFNFNKTVANRRVTFEIVSTTFKGQDFFYEESPLPGREFGFVYRQDGKGPSSPGTGFFVLLKQGSLEVNDFDISVPTTNEIVTVDIPNINNDDVWLFSLDPDGIQTEEWTKVPALTGNNIAYNSLERNLRNIYNVITKAEDKIDLVFSDGVYGNLPQGSFRTYYRVSNGLSYVISPAEMRGINISIPYVNKQGVAHELTISLGLKTSITNAAESEDIDSIRVRAPAIYYTQNRMITGEDYNLAPLSSSQNIVKVKAINRTSSGISRNFDIIDATGKYSSVNVFADDGFLYREETRSVLSFKFTNRLEIINFVKNIIEPQLSSSSIYNFYLTKFPKIIFSDTNFYFQQISKEINQATGYFVNRIDSFLLKVGTYTNNTLKYIFSGALVKFIPPAGKSFKNGEIVDTDPNDPDQRDRIWTKVVKVTGDGTNAGRGILSTGQGPIVFNDIVPTDAIISEISPRFLSDLSASLELEIANLMIQNLNFGLRYNTETSEWVIIEAGNLNLVSPFSLGSSGDSTGNNLDSSWLIAFIKKPDSYEIRVRGEDYIFGSLEQNRFYLDVNQKTYDSRTGKTIKDQIKILGINTDSSRINPLKQDLAFEASDTVKFEDGYESAREIKLSFADSDDDGVIDNPDAFSQIIAENLDFKYLFFEKSTDENGNIVFNYVSSDDIQIAVRNSQSTTNINDFQDGDLVYFFNQNENRIMKVDKNTNTFLFQPQYKAVEGRDKLKFQYIHNANVDRRIDPSVSNIVDIYLLTRTYDTEFRNYLSGAVQTKPLPPTSNDLKIRYGQELDKIKSISDEIIYYPVSYKILFGSTADLKFQAIFKVVKNPTKSINDNDLKVRIVNAIDTFFAVENWDFGDKFYIGELITYVINEVAPDVSNLVLVPRQPDQDFGSLFEIQSREDEIFVSSATVDDIEIVNSISAVEIRSSAERIISST
jgi:hypothetical protein